MSYVVLARKWRPQTFSDLVGQGHVSQTLSGAIARDRVAHAFLFTGVRGVGKTTSARILAKALNCVHGPTATPCLVCDACREIGEGIDVDVQEIDGASYTGVDAVRSLQETVPYRPQRDRFKIYIVDEVHMLSTPAWNAFLKTLEEPPPHVKFIFATTEVNKVPITILSRCQRYDFKLISTAEIAERLRFVLGEEGIKAEDEAVRVVAREAAGSMRDAMSLLDQVIAWTGGEEDALTAEGVTRVLGVASHQVLHDLGAAVVAHDGSRCLAIVSELAQQGLPLQNVARAFLEHLRTLVVAKVSEAPETVLELADEELADLKALAEKSSSEDLSRLYLGFSRAYDDIVRSAQVRGALEMALVRLAQRPPLLPLDELLRRLAALEQRLQGSGAGGGGGAQSGGSTRRPRHAPQQPHDERLASPPAGAEPAPVTREAVDAPSPEAAPHSSLNGSPTATRDAPPTGPVAMDKAPAFVPSEAPGFVAPEAAVSPSIAASAAVAGTSGTPAFTPPPAPAFRPPAFVPPRAPSVAASAAGAVTSGTPAFTPPPAPAFTPAFVPPRAPSVAASAAGAVTSGTPAFTPPPAPVFKPPAFVPPKARSFGPPTSPPREGPKAAPRSEAPGAPAGPPKKPLAEAIRPRWAAVVSHIREHNAQVASVFENAAVFELSEARAVVALTEGFLAEQGVKEGSRQLLQAALLTVVGPTCQLSLEASPRGGEVQSLAEHKAELAAQRVAEAKARVANHPLVVEAVEVLGARIRDVRLPAPP